MCGSRWVFLACLWNVKRGGEACWNCRGCSFFFRPKVGVVKVDAAAVEHGNVARWRTGTLATDATDTGGHGDVPVVTESLPRIPTVRCDRDLDGPGRRRLRHHRRRRTAVWLGAVGLDAAVVAARRQILVLFWEVWWWWSSTSTSSSSSAAAAASRATSQQGSRSSSSFGSFATSPARTRQRRGQAPCRNGRRWRGARRTRLPLRRGRRRWTTCRSCGGGLLTRCPRRPRADWRARRRGTGRRACRHQRVLCSRVSPTAISRWSGGAPWRLPPPECP